MHVAIVDLGGVRFLDVGGILIPLSRIKRIETESTHAACDNLVRIITDDPEEDLTWTHENADDIRKFLGKH